MKLEEMKELICHLTMSGGVVNNSIGVLCIGEDCMAYRIDRHGESYCKDLEDRK